MKNEGDPLNTQEEEEVVVGLDVDGVMVVVGEAIAEAHATLDQLLPGQTLNAANLPRYEKDIAYHVDNSLGNLLS